MAKKTRTRRTTSAASDTVDIAHSYRPASSIVKRLNALHDVAQLIDQARTRDEILEAIRTEGMKLLACDVCLVGLLNQSKSHYTIDTIRPVGNLTELDHKHYAVNEGMMGWAIKNRSIIFEEIEASPGAGHEIEQRIRETGAKSIVVVPMRTATSTIGSLLFGSIRSNAYNDEDASVAQMLGFCVGVALKNSNSVEGARKRIAQIELINDVSRKLSSELGLENVLSIAASTIQKTFKYFDVTVFLTMEDRSELSLEAHSGNFVDFLPHGYRQRMGEGIVGWVAQHGQRVLCNDVSQDPRYKVYEYHQTKSELALPIRSDGVVVGVLNVEDTSLHAFDETDAIVLDTLCDQLGNAIKNARLYEEAQRANMKLTELDKMKSEFLGIVSHDFRSPLSSIILAGKALLKVESVQEVKRVKEYLQIIVEQANRLNQLAEDTLSVAKLESGRLNYHFKVVNIDRLINDAISMVRITKMHDVQYDVEPDATFIKGDQSKLRQVVQNIVSNAVKYSPGGGRVRIRAAVHSPEEILFSVSDEGIGVPSEKAGRLFQKFSRIDNADSMGVKGAGLGLWICKEIVEGHGGRIWVEPNEGKGSTFKFTLKKAQE